jgi:hydrogenase small subunit
MPGIPPASRRDFVKVSTIALAAVGIPWSMAERAAEAAVQRKLKPSVVWLHFQECTGCTESLLRTSHPALSDLILDLVSLDYHETLFAAAGHQAEAALQKTMAENAGKYVLVVEGAVPMKDGGIYCMVGGRTAIDILNDVAAKAGAIIAIGSCASWGGIPSAEPNPTGATGVPMVLKGKTVRRAVRAGAAPAADPNEREDGGSPAPIVTIPGCPANPYNLLGVVLQYVSFGTLPDLDAEGRPKFAYGRTIHEHCARRAHFDAGRFVQQFGDENHRLGYCLYKMGCKGPVTHANCSTQAFGEVTDCWPIGIGHPCVGCTEQKVLWRTAIHETVEIEHLTPPDTYPAVHPQHKGMSAAATGFGGVVAGALVGAAWAASKKLGGPEADRDEASSRKEG